MDLVTARGCLICLVNAGGDYTVRIDSSMATCDGQGAIVPLPDGATLLIHPDRGTRYIPPGHCAEAPVALYASYAESHGKVDPVRDTRTGMPLALAVQEYLRSQTQARVASMMNAAQAGVYELLMASNTSASSSIAATAAHVVYCVHCT